MSASATGSAGVTSVAPATADQSQNVNPDDGDDAGAGDPPTQTQQTKPMRTDAGTPTMQASPGMPATSQGAKLCERTELQQSADAYLLAMASGSTQSLSLHPSLRYTENGADELLGAGIWLQQPQAVLSWHSLDERHCGSATEAVLRAFGSDIIFAVRLRYEQKQLIEAEAIVVTRQARNLFDPDAIVQTGTDPWMLSLPADKREEPSALIEVTQRFLDAAIVPSMAPPAAPGCKLRQNGVLTGLNGACVLPQDGDRFDEGRYPIVDVSTGVVAAIGRRRSYLIMVFAKIEQGTLSRVDAVGGMSVAKTGW